MSALGRLFGMSHRDRTGLVRMFEVEYSKEYKNARRNGVDITPKFVMEYFRNHR